jgi:hypothetical protein
MHYTSSARKSQSLKNRSFFGLFGEGTGIKAPLFMPMNAWLNKEGQP